MLVKNSSDILALMYTGGNNANVNNNYISSQFKLNLFMYVNNSHPKKSCLSIYIGKTCVITFPLVKNFSSKLQNFFNKYKNSTFLL